MSSANPSGKSPFKPAPTPPPAPGVGEAWPPALASDKPGPNIEWVLLRCALYVCLVLSVVLTAVSIDRSPNISALGVVIALAGLVSSTRR